jgi:hypothetical protein
MEDCTVKVIEGPSKESLEVKPSPMTYYSPEIHHPKEFAV